jgi:hypothetical protein
VWRDSSHDVLERTHPACGSPASLPVDAGRMPAHHRQGCRRSYGLGVGVGLGWVEFSCALVLAFSIAL